ncbi:MAG: rhodanese-like domain-containing protein [Candidatus Auribacterota bacterium]
MVHSLGVTAVVVAICLSVYASGVYAMGNKEEIEPGCLACLAQTEEPVYDLPVVDAAVAHQLWLGNKAVFVDALSEETYAVEHIPGAVNVPAKSQEANFPKMKDVSKDAFIVVYCAHSECGAAKKTASFLKDKGFTQVYYFKAGIKAWKEGGLPLES